MTEKRPLVIGANSVDFFWHTIGTIATVTSQGGRASVIALSNDESGELWKELNGTVKNVKRSS